MQLIVDIGNSRSKLALFQDGELLRHAVRPKDEALDTEAFLEGDEVKACIVSSVRKAIPDELESFNPLLLRPDTPLPVKISLKEVRSVGADRLANASAAVEYWPDKEVLVVDMGTCITYERIREGSFDGGAISPGLSMRARAMHEQTDRLPQVAINEDPPDHAQDTTGALQSGIFFGVLHEIKGRVEAFLRDHKRGVVVITGGDAPLVGKELKKGIFADPFLTLRGLDAILRFNA